MSVPVQFLTLNPTGGVPNVGVQSVFTTGSAFYVDSNATGGDGLTPDGAVTTLAAAIALCTAAAHDVIRVMAGHAETLSAALTIATSGIEILGEGIGENRPIFSFDTADTATIEFAAANLRISNCVFKVTKDGQDNMIDLQKANGVVDNCLFLEGSGVQFDTAIEISAAASDYCRLINNTIVSKTAGATSGILISGTADRLFLAGNEVVGDYSTAPITSAVVFTEAMILSNRFSNDQAGDFAAEFTDACTGMFIGNMLYSDAAATGLDPGSLKCLGNEHSAGIDQASVEIPLLDAGEGNTVNRPTGNIAQSADLSLFTVTGVVELVALVGRVTTIVQAQANASKLKFNPTTGSDVNLCSDEDINALALAALISITGNPGDKLQTGVSLVAGLAEPLIFGPGVIEQECDASSTGQILWTVIYRPVEPGSSIVAA